MQVLDFPEHCNYLIFSFHQTPINIKAVRKQVGFSFTGTITQLLIAAAAHNIFKSFSYQKTVISQSVFAVPIVPRNYSVSLKYNL